MRILGYLGLLLLAILAVSQVLFAQNRAEEMAKWLRPKHSLTEWVTADRNIFVEQDRQHVVILTPWLESIRLIAAPGAKGMDWRFNFLEEEQWIGQYLRSLSPSSSCYRASRNAIAELDTNTPGLIRLSPCLRQAAQARRNADKPPVAIILTVRR